jgi:hypothetical protein
MGIVLVKVSVLFSPIFFRGSKRTVLLPPTGFPFCSFRKAHLLRAPEVGFGFKHSSIELHLFRHFLREFLRTVLLALDILRLSPKAGIIMKKTQRISEIIAIIASPKMLV